MNIGLIAVDSEYPNLALMKISSWHKAKGDTVEWYNPFDQYDIVYMSKIFSFTPDYQQWMTNAARIEKGGTGYDLHAKLPEEVEFVTPDYSIYKSIDSKTAYGFLTRGCPNKCKWCVVPRKEGPVRPYMDVDDVAVDGRTNLILMDNNILACDYGLQQIEKIIERGYRVDFNQALDARLVTDDIAKLLAKVRWLNQIRFGCDTPKQIEECERVMQMIDSHRGKPASYLMYTMIGSDFDEAFHRLNHWRPFKRVRIVAQPFRDVDNPCQVIPQWQKDMARWAMRREIYASCEFKDFEPRKGFKCSEYFN
ncbi:MAG: radical SAM protein [Bacteroidaceae bacterium]|nr:radical SAM protein [Bacteroidaceae bacterium]